MHRATLILSLASLCASHATGASEPLFDTSVTYQAGDGPFATLSADVNADCYPDLIVADALDMTVSVFQNDGDGTFCGRTVYPVASNPASLFAADLDNDGDQDIAAATVDANSVSILLNSGSGTFGSYTAYAVNESPRCVYAADLDGDGDKDLVTSNAYSSDVSVLRNSGNATFSFWANYPVVNRATAVVAEDLDHDGDLDLVVANQYGDCVSVLFNDGSGNFSAHVVIPLDEGSRPHWLCVSDLNGDTHPDVATANQGADNVSVLLNNGSGWFPNRTTYRAGSLPRGVHAADFDGDGDPDLAVANYGSDDVSVLLNEGYGTFSPQITFAVGERPILVYADDLDNDGDIDLHTANFYSNDISVLMNLSDHGADPKAVITPDPVHIYQAFTIEPLETAVCFGDFDLPYTVCDINTASVTINGDLVPLTTVKLTEHPAFVGQVLESSVLLRDLLRPYGFPWDTSLQEVTVSGTFNDDTPFEVGGWFTLIGHISGDVNLDGSVNVADITYLVDYLFNQGPPPAKLTLGNVDCSVGTGELVTVADVTYLVAYLFQGGPTPASCL